MEYHLKFSEKKNFTYRCWKYWIQTFLQSLANLKFDEIDCLEKNKIKIKKFKKIFLKK